MKKSLHESNEIRQSWGLYVEETESFVRLIDFTFEYSGRPHYAWVANEHWSSYHNNSDQYNPASLYHPDLASIMQERESELMLVCWKANAQRPDRPQVYPDHIGKHHDIPKLYEVIPCRCTYNHEDLRAYLQSGIRYEYNPAEYILISFNSGKDTTDAAVFHRSHLNYDGSTITLSDQAPISVPIVTVSHEDIQAVPYRSAPNHERFIYIHPELPESTCNIALQPVTSYAREYVNWFIQTQQLHYSSQATQAAMLLLEQAFNKPESLQEYLGAQPYNHDFNALRNSINAIASPQSEEVSSFIYEIFAADRKLMYKFRDKAEAIVQAEMEEKRAQINIELQRLKEEQTQTAIHIHELEEQREVLEQQVHAHQHQLHTLQEEIQQQSKVHDAVMQRLEDDIALRLGLHAIAQQTVASSSQPTPQQEVLSLSAVGNTHSVTEVYNAVDALAHNLEILGLADYTQHTSRRCKYIAQQLLHTLSATKLLAVDSTFAATVANALSYTMRGIPASQVSIPINWSDSNTLEAALQSCDSPVVIVDNVFDCVNEAIAFGLARRSTDTKTVVILPVGAHTTIRLIAPELWEHMLYIPMIHMLQLSPSSQPLQAVQVWQSPSSVPQQNVLRVMEYIQKLPIDALPLSARTLVASVMAAGDASDDIRKWVIPQLALQLFAHGDEKAAYTMLDDLPKSSVQEYALGLLERIAYGTTAH